MLLCFILAECLFSERQIRYVPFLSAKGLRRLIQVVLIHSPAVSNGFGAPWIEFCETNIQVAELS